MVDIYVGKEFKHFHLPKDILCYYSTYFDRYFNGRFKEAAEHNLTLPEDRVEYFQHLLDYMILNGGDAIKVNGDWRQKMKYYMGFIEYIGKYDLLGALQMISVDLKKLMEEAFNLDNYSYRLVPVYIETVFRVLPEGHELRDSVAVLAMKYGILNGYYKTQEKMVDGFGDSKSNKEAGRYIRRSF
jgi:hypothetical protein